jgi:hypothetical protein
MDDFKPNKIIKSRYAKKKVNDKFYGTINVKTDCTTANKKAYEKNMIYMKELYFEDKRIFHMSDYKHRPTFIGMCREIPNFTVTFEYTGESISFDYNDE